MKKTDQKRIYGSFRQYFGDIWFILSHLFVVWRMLAAQRVSQAFAEKIMIAVTVVNDCVYCSRGHTLMALASGVDQSEVDQLLAQDIGQGVDEYESTGLAYAQHYAESESKPDPSATAALQEKYGSRVAQDIVLYIRLITIGNLVGNTFDHFLARFRGDKPEGGKLAFELVFMMLLPLAILFVPLVYLPVIHRMIAEWFVKWRNPDGKNPL